MSLLFHELILFQEVRMDFSSRRPMPLFQAVD